MKPETLQRFCDELRKVSHGSLIQFLQAILNEIRLRKDQKRHYNKRPAISEGKDCEPIRGA